MTRKEKKPTEKPAEKPSKGSSGIQLSNPERVVDKKSGATKQQVFDYYESVSDLIFPQLENRLLSLIRCPGGIAGECFFQKHLPKGDHTGLIGQQVETSEGPEEFFAVRKPVGILELCQQNAIEFHPWGSTLPKFEEPDLVVFDLDPDEGLEWSIVTDAARIVKGRLEELGLIPFTKVTGGKGIHVVCAIQPEYGWDDVKRMCETIAVQIEKENPTLFVTNMRKERRKGKIFLDFQRNSRGATAVAAYSLRARPGMPIAMPVEWDELDDLKSAAEIHLANVQDWLKTRKKDPWANLAKKAPSLKRILGT